MDTYCTIQARGPAGTTEQAVAAALDRVEQVDAKFNHLDSTSPIYAFNRDGTPITDPEIAGLIETALAVGEGSEGAFDVTVEPLLELWGFYGESPTLPDSADIEDARERVGRRHLEVADGRVDPRRDGVRIDLGAIAKGYALAQAAEVLRAHGIDSALIDAGGDIYALGANKGKNWGIGIRDPRGGEGIIGVIDASDLAVVTSGDYERFFTVGETKYSHILDPRTGYPARGVVSVTVVARDPALADAWATALFVLGPDGLELAERAAEIEALIITDDLEVVATANLSELAGIDSLERQ